MIRPITVAVILLLLSVGLADASCASDDGAIGISSIDDLKRIGTAGYPLNGHYVQTADIDLSGAGSNDKTQLFVDVTASSSSVMFTVSPSSHGPYTMKPGESLWITLDDMTMESSSSSIAFGERPTEHTNTAVLRFTDEDGTHTAFMTFTDSDLAAGISSTLECGSNIDTIGPAEFSGTYDGKGHTIRGVRSVSECASLFASSDGAVFKNIKVEGLFVTSSRIEQTFDGEASGPEMKICASVLVGNAKNTEFRDVTIDADVICLDETLSTITVNSSAVASSLSSISCAGAVTGTSERCRFLNCVSNGSVASVSVAVTNFVPNVHPSTVNINDSFQASVGGITGSSNDDNVAFCTSSGEIMSFSVWKYTENAPTVTSAPSSCTLLSNSNTDIGGMIGKATGVRLFGCVSDCSLSEIGKVSFSLDRTYITGIDSDICDWGGVIGEIASGSVECCLVKTDIGRLSTPESGVNHSGGVFGNVLNLSLVNMKSCLVDSTLREGNQFFGLWANEASDGWNTECFISERSVSDPFGKSHFVEVPMASRNNPESYSDLCDSYPWEFGERAPQIVRKAKVTFEVNDSVSDRISLTNGSAYMLKNDFSVTYASNLDGRNIEFTLTQNGVSEKIVPENGIITIEPTFDWNTMTYADCVVCIANPSTEPVLPLICIIICGIAGAVLLFFNAKSLRA